MNNTLSPSWLEHRLRLCLFLVAAGCLALLWLAGTALHGALTSAHFEGYILLIALLLPVQVALTIPLAL